MEVNLNNYPFLATRTENKQFSQIVYRLSGNDVAQADTHKNGSLIRFLHGAIGLAGESGEIVENMLENKGNAVKKEEIGDVCWYMAIVCDSIGYSFNRFFGNNQKSDPNADSDIKVFCLGTGAILDQAKRAVFYGSPIHSGITESGLNTIAKWIEAQCLLQSISLRDVLQANIDKLKSRYPEKYNDQDANNRDIQAEQDIVK